MAGNVLGELLYKINADTTGLNNGINASSGKVQGFGNKLAGMIPAALIIAAATAAGKAVLKLGTDAVETESKFGVVFSNVGEQAAMAVAELNKSYGMARLTAQEMLSATGDILSGFGFDQGTALSFSTNIAKISTDIASFKNVQGGAAAVSEAVTKAMLGEREMLKTLGIAILEEDVKTQMLKESKAGLVYESERQAKAAATYNLILEKSANAQGDFARTSQSNANQIRVFQETLKDAGATIGKDLQPAISSVLQGLNESFPKFIAFINPMIPAFNKMGDVLGNAIKLAGELFEALKPVMDILGVIVETSLTAADNILTHVTSIVSDFNTVNEKVKQGGKELLAVYQATGEAAKNPQKAAEQIASQIARASLEGRSLDIEVRKIAESTGYSVEQVSKYAESLGFATEERKKELQVMNDALKLQLIQNHIQTVYINAGKAANQAAVDSAKAITTTLTTGLLGADKTWDELRKSLDLQIATNKALNEVQENEKDSAEVLAQKKELILQYEKGIAQLKLDGAKMDASGNVKLVQELEILREQVKAIERMGRGKKESETEESLSFWDEYISKLEEAAKWENTLAESLSILGTASEKAFNLIGESITTGKDNWVALKDVAVNAIADILAALGQQMIAQAALSIFTNPVASVLYGAGAIAAYAASSLVRSWATQPEGSGAGNQATPPTASSSDTSKYYTGGDVRTPIVIQMDDGSKLSAFINRQIKQGKIVTA